MSLLLDTNAYSGLMQGHPGVVRRVRAAENIVMSVIVIGELLYGFRHGGRYEENVAELNLLLANPFVSLQPVTEITSDRFSRIALALRKKGKPIPSNDMWIAAHAMQMGAELLSRDRHFEFIDGLVWTLF